MKIPAMIAAELRRLTAGKMPVLALMALMIVPLLYGGLYLWANQDPYGELDHVPAALVVSDTGATVDGTHHDFGDEVADRLVEDGTFQWHRVDEAQAKHGIDTQKYDFSVTLPADFSSSLVSSTGAHPHQAKVILTTNDAGSYLSTTIGKQAIQTIQASIVAEVNKQAAGRFLASLATIRTSLNQASDGAGQLADGAQTAASGASDLADGTKQVADGAGTLAGGASDLAAGLGKLKNATSSLPAQTRKLADGARQVAAGDAKIADVGDRVGSVAQRAADAVPDARHDISADLSKLVDDGHLTRAQADAILDRLDRLGDAIDDGNAEVQSGVGQIDRLASGSAQVADGAEKLAQAAPSLAGGISDASAGANKLKTGAASLADGAKKTDAGAQKLADALPALHTGAATLRDKLADGAHRIPASTEASRAAQAKNIADPVHISHAAVTNAGTYGAGLAPFFVALAAWIGIYALFLIVKPVSKRAITALRSPVKVMLAGWLTPGMLGAIQMIGLFAIVAGWLGFGVEHPWGTYAFMALASLTYTAIILALNVWLGSVGQFLGLVLMVLQLVTAGGTFPWQTLPAPLAALHHVLPMGFVVDALRQLMYGGNLSFAVSDGTVMLWWLLGSLILAALGVVRMTHRRTLRDLEPSLIG